MRLRRRFNSERLPSGGLLLFAVALFTARIQTKNMLIRRTAVMLIAIGLLGSLMGCTVYPEKKPPTVASTTSAEQLERIYWDAVKKGNWQQVVALQGPSVLFTNRAGNHLSGPEWVDFLKQDPPSEYMIGAVEIRPQGADMVLSYFASVTDKKSTSPVELAVVSVWQHVGANLILVAHSETPRVSATK